MSTAHDRLEALPDTRLFGPPPGHGRAIWALVSAITVGLLVLHAWQWGLDAASLVVAALLVIAGAAALLPAAEAGGARLPSRWAWIAAAAAALVPFALLWDAAAGQHDGYAPWYLRGATIVLAAVILRRQPAAGWTSALAGYVVIVALGITAGAPPVDWALPILRQAAALLTIQVLAVMLHRSRRAVAMLQQEERSRLESIRNREAATGQRRAEAERIRSLVTPTLQRIAAGEAGAELRREALLLEGALRDTLRGRRLATGAVASAARAARERGVDVVLLDDLGEEQLSPDAAMLTWVAARLDASPPPRATVRLSADTRGRLTVSFYAERAGGAPEFLTRG